MSESAGASRRVGSSRTGSCLHRQGRGSWAALGGSGLISISLQARKNAARQDMRCACFSVDVSCQSGKHGFSGGLRPNLRIPCRNRADNFSPTRLRFVGSGGRPVIAKIRSPQSCLLEPAPAFGTAPAVGPQVSPAICRGGEAGGGGVQQRDLAEEAASNWRSAMAPLYERRAGPRKVAVTANDPGAVVAFGTVPGPAGTAAAQSICPQ